MGSDWISRVTIPDMYPRQSDPYRPRQGSFSAPVLPGDAEQMTADPLTIVLTQAGQRPTVTQRATNYVVPVTTAGVPLAANRLEVDAFIIDVPSTAANNVFLGFGSGVTTGSGIEVVAGVPLFFSPTNQREQWELQRAMEYLCAVMGTANGVQALPQYKAPRVVLNAGDWWLIATAATNVTVMLFFIPEQQ